MIEKLTPREEEVAKLLCQGKTNQEIADELGTSYHTVKQQVGVIFLKYFTKNRTEFAIKYSTNVLGNSS